VGLLVVITDELETVLSPAPRHAPVSPRRSAQDHRCRLSYLACSGSFTGTPDFFDDSASASLQPLNVDPLREKHGETRPIRCPQSRLRPSSVIARRGRASSSARSSWSEHRRIESKDRCHKSLRSRTRRRGEQGLLVTLASFPPVPPKIRRLKVRFGSTRTESFGFTPPRWGSIRRI
jgi:hypothetical protein